MMNKQQWPRHPPFLAGLFASVWNAATLSTCRPISVSILVFLATAWNTSHASLIERDLFTPGDQLLTFDTTSGLEWLDLDQTTLMSSNDFLAGAGGWLSLGFMHANIDQVHHLYEQFGIVDFSGASVTSNVAGITAILQVMGCTGNCGTTLPSQSGFAELVPMDPVIIGLPYVELRQLDGMGSVHLSYIPPNPEFSRDYRNGFQGNYLVRAVPEPSTSFLIGIGLAGMLARRCANMRKRDLPNRRTRHNNGAGQSASAYRSKAFFCGSRIDEFPLATKPAFRTVPSALNSVYERAAVVSNKMRSLRHIEDLTPPWPPNAFGTTSSVPLMSLGPSVSNASWVKSSKSVVVLSGWTVCRLLTKASYSAN